LVQIGFTQPDVGEVAVVLVWPGGGNRDLLRALELCFHEVFSFDTALVAKFGGVDSSQAEFFAFPNPEAEINPHPDRSSRPGEFHPKSLTDPYVSLSTHTALIVQSQQV